MNDKELDEKIAATRAELRQLETRKTNRSQLTDAERLAIEIHSLLCHHDHGQDCSWLYEIDSNDIHDWQRPAHRDALAKAMCVLNVTHEAKAMEIIRALKVRA